MKKTQKSHQAAVVVPLLVAVVAQVKAVKAKQRAKNTETTLKRNQQAVCEALKMDIRRRIVKTRTMMISSSTTPKGRKSRASRIIGLKKWQRNRWQILVK